MNKKVLNISIVLLFLAYGAVHWGAHFFITVLAISFLIFFHELGHFLAAKHVGVKVNVFSVGFGQKIFTKTINGTQYAISSIPLGGYVSLKGQDDLDPNAKSYDKDSYNVISPLKRIYILFAGPFFNIFLAFLIFIALGFIGIERLAPTVGTVAKDLPASNAGIQKGDKIISINGIKIKEWDEISKQVGFEPLNIVVDRDSKLVDIYLTPKISTTKNIWGEEIQKPLIGISPKGDLVTIYNKGFSSLPFALKETVNSSKLIMIGLEKLITGVVPIKDMGGIVRMTDITTKASQINLSVFLIVVALISVNLGVLNLLPIPVLDGGHIAFNLYELIFKKPISDRVTNALIYTGMALLFALMSFTIINDIIQLSKGSM